MLIVNLVLALKTVPAVAYVDPATTSYIIQIVVGVAIACSTAAGIIVSRIRRKFRKKEDEKEITQNLKTDEMGGVTVSAAELLDENDGEEKK